MSKPDHTSKIYRALRKRFCPPAWALLLEVSNATGGRAKRSADGVAISLYPSRGLEIHGLEVKVSRSDWLRELKDPEKSAPVQQFCHRWWTTAPPGVVLEGELPPTWGLLELQSGGVLRAKVKAPRLSPVAPSIHFVAALGRRMNEAVDRAVLAARHTLEDGDDYQSGYAAAKKELPADTKRVERAHADLLETVKVFEQASGVSIIAGWQHQQVGEAVRSLVEARAGGWGRAKDVLDGTIRSFTSLLERLHGEREALASFAESAGVPCDCGHAMASHEDDLCRECSCCGYRAVNDSDD